MKANIKLAIMLVLPVMFMITSLACVDLIGKQARIEGSGNLIRKDFNVDGFTGLHLGTKGTMHIEFGDKTELIVEAEDNLMPYIEAYVKEGVLYVKARDDYNLRPNRPINYYVAVPGLDMIRASSSGDIQAPDIEADKLKITASSSGNIFVKNIDASELEIRVSGSGNVTLRDVFATEMNIRISSSGDVAVRKIEAPSLYSRISSSGNVIVDNLDADELTARISSSGNMKVERGSVPKQSISISSSGDYKAENLESDDADISISSSGDVYVNVKQHLKADLSGSGSIHYSGNPRIDSKESSSGGIVKSD